MKIKISTIIAFMLYHVIFINLPYFETIYNPIKYAFLIIIFVFLLFHLKIIFSQKEYKRINKFILLYAAWICISSIMNKAFFYRGIIYALKVVELFFFFEYMTYKNEKERIIRIFYRLTMFYCLVTDIVLIIFPQLYLTHNAYYLIGNKFTVSYMHIILTILYIYINNCKKNNNYSLIKTTNFLHIIICLIISYMTRMYNCYDRNSDYCLLSIN